MVRWEPGAHERLAEAALESYATKGFDETTVAEIAQAAGVTERTFYRYFADKREVLFAGSALLQQHFVDAIVAAPTDATPIEMVMAAVAASAEFFPDERRAYSRRRFAVIDSNPELAERELRKMSTLAAAVASALRDRGVAEPAATLAAETARTVFHVSFGLWVAPGSVRDFAGIQRQVFAELQGITAG